MNQFYFFGVRIFFRLVVTLIFLFGITANSFSQLQLEFDSASYPGTVPNGPSIANQTASLRLNTTGNTFADYTIGSQPITVTAAWSNQQFTNVPGGGAQTGAAFGGNLNNSIKSAASAPVWYLLNYISNPSDAMFTSNPYGAAGTGIDINANSGFLCDLTSEPLYAAGTAKYPLKGRYYYADLTITFSRPISNPVFHFSGLGGYSSNLTTTQGFSTEFDLATAGVTMTRLSGDNVFKVTSTQIVNNAGTITATSSATGNVLPDGAGTGAATGSVRMTGNNITSIVFHVYFRGDGKGTTAGWSTVKTWACDVWLLSISMNAPAITGNVFNDTNGLTDNTVNGIGTNVNGSLYMNLVDQNYNTVQCTPVQPDGTFAFQDLLPISYPVSYTARLSVFQGTPGSAAPIPFLPPNWVNTGEFIGAGPGSDGLINGISSVFSLLDGTTVVTYVDFGIIQVALLDVTMESFCAAKQDNTTALKWITANEQNITSYIIERSTNGNDYSQIGDMEASGDSGSGIAHHFTDNNPAEGINYYRIKMTGENGAILYSQVCTVDFSANKIISAYPNPATNNLTLTGVEAGMQLRVLSLDGHIIAIKTATGDVEMMPVEKLAPGIYFVQAIKNGSLSTTIKFSKH